MIEVIDIDFLTSADDGIVLDVDDGKTHFDYSSSQFAS